MVKIAAQSAFSRAAIGRHSLKCLARHTAEKHKTLALQIPIVAWPASGPDGPRCHVLFREKLLTVSEVNKMCANNDYCIWEVAYSQPSDEALANAKAYADALAARDGAPEEIPVGVMLPLRVDEPADEMFFFREPEPETPVQLKPESPSGGMADLLAHVKSMLNRRCG
jgi:hypothetical protein